MFLFFIIRQYNAFISCIHDKEFLVYRILPFSVPSHHVIEASTIRPFVESLSFIAFGCRVFALRLLYGDLFASSVLRGLPERPAAS